MKAGPTLTAAETAGRLGLSLPRIRELVRQGRLHGQVVGRRLQIEESSVERYQRLEANVIPERAPRWY